MNEITTEIKAQKETSKRGKGFLIAIIVLILVILGVGTVFFLKHQTTASDLFIENFNPLPDAIVNRNEEENDLLTIGMAAYSHQDYSVAALHLEQFINRDNSTETNKRNVLIYLGIAHLALGNVNTAIHNFNKITQENPTFREAAEWYLALAFFKKGDFQNCEKQLNIIQGDKQHEYHAVAENLLAKIKDLKKK